MTCVWLGSGGRRNDQTKPSASPGSSSAKRSATHETSRPVSIGFVWHPSTVSARSAGGGGGRRVAGRSGVDAGRHESARNANASAANDECGGPKRDPILRG